MDIQTSKVNSGFSEIKDCLAKKQYAKAEELILIALRENSESDELYFHLGNLHHQQGMIGKAIKDFEKVLHLRPDHTDAAISLSVIYNDIGKYDEAKRVFDRANERIKGTVSQGNLDDNHINKKFSAKHFELAELYMSYGRYDDALFEYNKSIALDMSHLEARIKISKVYAKKGFFAKAADELKKLRNEHPNFIPARLHMGVLYYGNGNIIEAQSEWEKVLSINPRSREAQMYLNLSKSATETRL